LVEERAQREKKLARAFDRKTADEIRRRLKRAATHMAIPADTEPLTLTLAKLAQLGRDYVPLTEKTLHQYRIIGKRARYIAELSDNEPEARRVVERLKHMQDVIGDWHDWLKLTQKAEKLLGEVRDSVLLVMLRNVTQAKFRQSLDAVAEIRKELAGRILRPATPQIRKPSRDEAPRTAAVA
jgi:CHAD domain-containing protein